MSPSRAYSSLQKDLSRHEGLLSEEGVKTLFRMNNVVLLESVQTEGKDDRTLLFIEPTEIIRARRVKEVVPALVRAQMHLEKGSHIAGYVSYEAGPAFLPTPQRDPSDGPPFLLWFGVYPNVITMPRRPGGPIPEGTPGRFTIGQVEPEITEDHYLQRFATIRRYLEMGNSYQVNYTFPVEGRWSGSLSDLYLRLRLTQPVSYGSIVSHDGYTLLSFSPELFFRVEGRSIMLKPMKGTAPRGRTRDEDREQREALGASEKDRAENRMIVDLLRNDIGRIAEAGSVKVRSFFDIETYESVLQATSTIEARLKEPTALVDLFQVLFPSGSVTGAPKIETMRIIHEVEERARGPYTGAIGYAGPDGDMAFNVAIRTLTADQHKGIFRLDVGSGITIASDPRKEYQECLQKALFVSREPVVFQLFETILWTPEGYRDLQAHLDRMRASAQYFGWTFRMNDVDACAVTLERETLRHSEQVEHRVRIAYAKDGTCTTAVSKLVHLQGPLYVGFSKRVIASGDRFQFHKTTNRQVYDTVLEEADARGWFDAIVLNERNEVAEGARSNLFIERDGVLYTPPLSAGILPGTMRQRILERKKPLVLERPLRKEDVIGADRVFMSNALRGFIEVEIVS